MNSKFRLQIGKSFCACVCVRNMTSYKLIGRFNRKREHVKNKNKPVN